MKILGQVFFRSLAVNCFPKYSAAFCVALLLHAVLSSNQDALAKESGGMPEVILRGAADATLRDALSALTPLFWRSSQPPASEVALRSRARRHDERLLRALAAEGYYAAAVDFEILWDAPRPQVTFDIVPGPAYRLDRIEVVCRATPAGEPLSPPPVYVSPGLQPGAVARAEAILEGEKQLVAEANNAGYPFASVHDRRVVVEHDKQRVNVTYFLALGAQLAFGTARLEGLEKVRPETVLRELPWREGETYRASLVAKAQETLQRSGLFTMARVMPAPPEEAADGAIPIVVEVAERRHRSISLGLQYRTDEGVGLGGHWEHRNFAARGRRLRIQSNVTEIEQSFSIDYDYQQFRRKDQTLTLFAKSAQLDPDPYRSRRFDIGAWVERKISPEWTIGMGPALRLSRVREPRRTQQYYLASFPMQAAWDRRDDRLDPTRGFRFTNRLTPFVDVTNINTHFLKNELSMTHYLQFADAPSLTLAARLRLGVMGGAGLGGIPADERFYAGGGGSIRGYAYQKVGPLDKDGEPTGGRSLTDWSIELRHRINEQFGVVFFVDGGMAHKSVYPDFGDTPQWGAGIGARYFTPIGPMRLDVAAPLNRRRGLDSSVQFYINIGQAF